MNTLFQKLKDYFTKEYSEDTFSNSGNLDKTSSDRRSAAYRRHFEGYTTYTGIDEKGKKHTYRVYTGVWYSPALTKGQKFWRKVLYAFFLIFCFVVLMFSATQNIRVNSLWYNAMVQAIAAGCLLWLTLGLFNYLIAPEQRTVGEWKASTGSLKKSIPATTFAFGVNFLINVVYLFYAGNDNLVKQLICIALYLGGTGVLLVWYKLENNVTYLKTKSNDKAD